MPIATKSSKIDISKEIITQKIAEKIASKVSKNTTLLFYGNIGVGKTTFIRYFINQLQKKNKLEISEVPSPTFNLIHEYKICLLYTSPSPRDRTRSRMPSSA